MELHAGQSWTYRTPPGYEASRLLIGAIASFGGHRNIVCVAVVHAPRRHADGQIEMVTIPFLPMTEQAFRATAVTLEEDEACLPEAFGEKFHEWSNDPKGLTVFTVSFDGYLDHLIADQVAEIAGLSAA